MSEVHLHPVKPEWSDKALINNDQYLSMYKQSVEDSEGFWAEQGKGWIGSSPILR